MDQVSGHFSGLMRNA